MNGWIGTGCRGATLSLVLSIAGAAGAADLGFVPVGNTMGGMGDVAYINGGVSRDEADAMRNAAPSFPLQLVFTRRGEVGTEFVADASLLITDDRGHRIVQLDGQGPIFLARVPDGRYFVVAEHGGRRQTRQVEVLNGRTRTVEFLWG